MLPFRTEDQTTVTLRLARRYGKGAVHYDRVELIEDDRVRIGDVSPAPNPFPETTAFEQTNGYLVSAQPWLRSVYPTYYPARDEIGRVPVCRLAPGEYEPLTLSLTALRAMEGVRVSLAGDLKGPGEATLAATNISVGIVRTMTRWLTNREPLTPGQRFERTPTFIYPNQAFDVPARETSRLWLTAYAPEAQSPGLYEGALTIAPSNAPSSRVSFRIEVLPIELVRPEPTYLMYFSHIFLDESFRNEPFMHRALADMRAHGMNANFIYAELERQQPDGSWTIDLERPGDPNSLPRQMERLKAAGMLGQNRPQTLISMEVARHGQLFNQEKLVQAVGDLCRQRGWPEMLWYLVDEPGTPQQFELARKLTEIVHRVPGARTTTAVIPKELVDCYDVWVPGIPGQMRELRELSALAAKGPKELWSYNCTWNGNNPINDRLYAGYFMWATGVRGNWQWCYTDTTASRIGAAAGTSPRLTDKMDLGAIACLEDPWYAVYVLPTREANIPTLGFEARREGIDDYRYLQTLSEAVAKAMKSDDPRTRERAAEAQAFLDAVKVRTYPPEEQVVPQSNSGQNWMLMHPGLKPEDYDAIRWRAVDFILELRGP
ncbi:MAG: hypothetical protein PHR35_12235 [Kiritimatiellae bacterium]|nr:hypothetical protein [Kiritimatiellia bacterium]